MANVSNRATYPMTGRDAAPSLAGTLSTPLFWAVIGSIVVHTAFVAMPQSLPRRGSATTADQGPPLQATLVAPPTPPSEPEAEVAVADVSSPIQLAAQEAVAPPLPPAAVDQRPQSSSAAVVGVGAGDVRIDGALLVDRNRMGEVWTRQMTEFPIEVDYPARLDEKILARYPPAALAAGREDSVAVWIVVDANGAADEVVVLDGSEEFANAVVAAVKQARFLPAQNNLLPIRFPISLEFRFVIGPQAVAGAAGVAR